MKREKPTYVNLIDFRGEDAFDNQLGNAITRVD